jgi:hypothetical protein
MLGLFDFSLCHVQLLLVRLAQFVQLVFVDLDVLLDYILDDGVLFGQLQF